MNIVVNTSNGTFIVPSEKESSLIAWLQANALRPGASKLQEELNNPNNVNQGFNVSQRHLLND